MGDGYPLVETGPLPSLILLWVTASEGFATCLVRQPMHQKTGKIGVSQETSFRALDGMQVPRRCQTARFL